MTVAVVLAAGLVAAAGADGGHCVVRPAGKPGHGRRRGLGLGFVPIAVVAGLVGNLATKASPARRWLLVALVGVWGSDWRSTSATIPAARGGPALRSCSAARRQVGMARAVRKVFCVEGFARGLVRCR